KEDSMRRKDGKPKRRARRTMPRFDYGFRDNPAVQDYLHPTWRGEVSPMHWRVASLFAGCGGLDLGLTGGFNFLNRSFDRLPFDVVAAIDNASDAVEAYRLNLGSEATVADL